MAERGEKNSRKQVVFFTNIRNISLLSLSVAVFTPNYYSGENTGNIKFQIFNQKILRQLRKKKGVLKVAGIWSRHFSKVFAEIENRKCGKMWFSRALKDADFGKNSRNLSFP